MKTDSPSPCELLQWDTDFWGFRIARVRDDTLTAESLNAIETWCLRNEVCCAYFLSRPDCIVTARLAPTAGFYITDARLTLARQLTGDIRAIHPASSPGVEFRPGRREDIPHLEEIARHAFRDTRFYFDSRFPRELCHTLYATWTRLDCEGRADAVFVAEVGSQPAAFISCRRDGSDRGSISLVAVAPVARGQGIGQRLVRTALEWLADRGASKVFVVTQGRNYAAQHLYHQCGFLPHSMGLWYHKWYQ